MDTEPQQPEHDSTSGQLLELRGISKRFAGVQALSDVSLHVNSGEVLALIGENGAGKSTLMKVLGGVHQPDSGEIWFGGKAVRIRGVRDAINLGISFIHQELNTLDNIDVAGNVFLGREPLTGGPLKLLDRRKMYAETQPFLDQLGLGIPADLPLSQLSLAQQQLVEIAKALSLKAKVLIMDEPTSALTLTETDRLLEVVRQLRASGVGIIYITHRMSEIVAVADRVSALRDGRNAGDLAKDAITHESMVRLMVGRDIDKFVANKPDTTRKAAFNIKALRTKRYPKQEVSFTIHHGEILGIAGLVGAGRSEVAQAIFGVDPPLSGSVEDDDGPIKIRNSRDAIRHGIFLAPEDRKRSGVILELPIRENVTLPALKEYSSMGLIKRAQEEQAALNSSRALGVKAPTIAQLVRNLSGGNQQKVVLARWLSLKPKLLILDEPTRGIDVGAKAEIYELMRKLAEEGVAVLMISSELEEVLNLSDRIAVMHEGAIAGFLSREDASEESIMRLAVGH
jgi:ribose transport system ATP-binding protein